MVRSVRRRGTARLGSFDVERGENSQSPDLPFDFASDQSAAILATVGEYLTFHPSDMGVVHRARRGHPVL